MASIFNAALGGSPLRNPKNPKGVHITMLRPVPLTYKNHTFEKAYCYIVQGTKTLHSRAPEDDVGTVSVAR